VGSAGRRRAVAALWLAALVAVILALVLQLSPQPTRDTAASASDGAEARPAADDEQSRQGPRPIMLRSTTQTAEDLEPVRVTGSYPEAPEGTRLVVQWRREGSWVALPLPTAVLATGRFRTYVQLGEEGRQRLRVADMTAGTVSNAITIRIR